MSLKKRLIMSTTIALIGVLISTPLLSTVFAMEINTALGISYEENTIGNYINSLNTEKISVEDQKILELYNENVHVRVKRGTVSIATKIIKKFGKRYLTRQIPKIIYKKLPKSITKKVSESAFLGVWKRDANSVGYMAQGVVGAII